MIRATVLTKQFGEVVALDRLDLEVAAGEVVALLGANGAGKTTTIYCLLGFLAPDSGTATVDGIDTQRDPRAVRQRTAFIPENVGLHDYLSAVENLQHFAALSGQDLDTTSTLAALEAAGLPAAAANRRVATYSKGMRQKVAIATAFAKQAKVYLLDEPTSGLDPEASNDLMQTLRSAASTRGAAVLMATHDLFRAKEVADRIGIMRAGVLVAMLRASEIAAPELERLYLEHMR